MVKHEIKSVSISSAFKIGLMVNALLAALFGGIVMLFQAVVLSSLTSISSLTINGRQADLNFTGITLGALCLAWIVSVGLAAILGGVVGAFAALFYNLAARSVGGIEYTAAVYQADTDPIAGQWELTNRAGY